MAALRILLLEDSESDAKLIERALRQGGLEFAARRVETREQFLAALLDWRPDVILADYRLPRFDGRSALALAQDHLPRTPVLIVTGTLADDVAVDLLREGAADYVLKDRLSRLVPAVRGAIEHAAARAARLEAEKKYRSLFELASDGIVLLDAASGAVVDCNPAFEEQAGLTLRMLGERVLWEGWPADRAAAARATFREAEAGRIPGSEVLELCRPDGSFLPVELRASAIEVGGRHCTLAQVRDISERLRDEAQLLAQIDELRRFQSVTVDRELRLQELEERLARLEPPGVAAS